MINVNKATAKELLEFYNKHADKKVKKFASVAKGRERVSKLLETMGQKPAKAKKAKKVREPVTPEEARANRQAGARRSWGKEEVANARRKRHKVKVGGKEFRSVRAAFAELELPMSKHIAFRAKLVENGKATFEGHRFTLAN